MAPCIGYQSTLLGMSGWPRVCFVDIWVFTKQYLGSYRGHLKRYLFFKSASFQSGVKIWGARRPCIGYQSTFIGMIGCVLLCLVDIWVLKKENKITSGPRSVFKEVSFLKKCLFSRVGTRLGRGGAYALV